MSRDGNQWFSFPHRTSLAGGRAQNLQRLGREKTLKKVGGRIQPDLISPRFDGNTIQL
jgi:hypothetical protein